VGVLTSKEFASTNNGQAYSRWQLSDLRAGELRVVLFGDAHAAHKATVRRGAGARGPGQGRRRRTRQLDVGRGGR
jgi:hypothetical protein